MNWCEHNVWINGNAWVLNTMAVSHRAVCTDEMFCPICGEPRPREKKNLSENLAKTWNDGHQSMGMMADTALDVFEGMVRETNKAFDKKTVCMGPMDIERNNLCDELLQKIKEAR